MATIKIEPAGEGTHSVWVSLTRFCADDLARLKEIPGHRWNPERRQWQFPDTPETRKQLAEMVAMPPAPPPKMIAVRPRDPHPCPSPVAKSGRQGKGRYVAGRDKPLTTNPPHPLIKKVDDELVLRGMAYGTRKSYGQHLRNYFAWLANGHIEAEKATREQIRSYLVEMATSGLACASYCRGARAALLLLYETVLKQGDKVRDLPLMKGPQKLPIVLSREEVMRLFKVTKNLKHLALLQTAYSAGLRVGEVVRLKVSDIDRPRMLIRVNSGKGAKDRYVLLSQVALQTLRDYWRADKPKTWLFPGDNPTDHLSERHAQQVFRDSKKRAGILKPATFHTLRHSFATHMLEDGVDIRYIMEFMGHGSIRTTEIYTHVTEKGLERIRSPLDRIQSEGGDGR